MSKYEAIVIHSDSCSDGMDRLLLTDWEEFLEIEAIQDSGLVGVPVTRINIHLYIEQIKDLANFIERYKEHEP